MHNQTGDSLPPFPLQNEVWNDHDNSSTSSDALSRYLEAAVASSTRRAYQSDIAHFVGWGGSIPATDRLVGEYLAAHAGQLAVSTLRRRLAAIAVAHHGLRQPNPCASELVRLFLRGIMRVHGTQQQRVKPLCIADLVRMSAAMG